MTPFWDNRYFFSSHKNKILDGHAGASAYAILPPNSCPAAASPREPCTAATPVSQLQQEGGGGSVAGEAAVSQAAEKGE